MLKSLATFAFAGIALVGSPAFGQRTHNPGTNLPDIRDAKDVNLYSVAAVGGMACMLAARKEGVDKTYFENDGKWVRSPDGAGFVYATEPVMISFPADPDAIQRICVVEAELASRDDQLLLARLLMEQIGQAPQIQEGHSIFWVIGGPTDFRGLQMYPDEVSEKPKVRLIGAAF